MRDKESTLTIIIPVYNEEKSIAKVLKEISSLDFERSKEIIVVDDGSTDNTRAFIKDANSKIIHHDFNKGYGASIKSGIRAASGDVIAVIDADGQHNPRDIIKLLKELNGYDMVVGARSRESHKVLWRQPGRMLIGWVAGSLSRTHIPDINSGLRIFKKDVVSKYLHLLPNGFSLSTTITVALLKDGYNINYVPIKVNKRQGKSTLRFFDGFRVLLSIIRLIMIFSPLRIFIPASLSVLMVGGYLMVVDMINLNIQDITILVILAGMLIFFFGLIVDQIAHIRRELKQ